MRWVRDSINGGSICGFNDKGPGANCARGCAETISSARKYQATMGKWGPVPAADNDPHFGQYDPRSGRAASLYVKMMSACDPGVVRSDTQKRSPLWSTPFPDSPIGPLEDIVYVGSDISTSGYPWGYVAKVRSARRIVVAFRGADDSDMLRAITPGARRYTHPKLEGDRLALVYSPFYAEYLHLREAHGARRVLDIVKQYVSAMLEEGGGLRDIVITGHSMGGTLATYTALDLALDRPDLKRHMLVHTFGMPNVGNWWFASLYNRLLMDRTYRITRRGDHILKWPPAFYPVGREVYYGGGEALAPDQYRDGPADDGAFGEGQLGEGGYTLGAEFTPDADGMSSMIVDPTLSSSHVNTMPPSLAALVPVEHLLYFGPILRCPL